MQIQITVLRVTSGAGLDDSPHLCYLITSDVFLMELEDGQLRSSSVPLALPSTQISRFATGQVTPNPRKDTEKQLCL